MYLAYSSANLPEILGISDVLEKGFVMRITFAGEA